jgi:hypothetical protein
LMIRRLARSRSISHHQITFNFETIEKHITFLGKVLGCFFVDHSERELRVLPLVVVMA